jgi:hypothetical protein
VGTESTTIHPEDVTTEMVLLVEREMTCMDATWMVMVTWKRPPPRTCTWRGPPRSRTESLEAPSPHQVTMLHSLQQISRVHITSSIFQMWGWASKVLNNLAKSINIKPSVGEFRSRVFSHVFWSKIKKLLCLWMRTIWNIIFRS